MGTCCASTSSNMRVPYVAVSDDKDEMQDEVDHNAAVDYALKKNNQRTSASVHEIILSASNLPDQDIIGTRSQTFAVMYFDLNTLDDHDKKVMGGLTENEIMMLNGEEPSFDELEEGETETDRQRQY